MLITEYRSSLGKSSRGGETLYDHTMACVRIAHAVLTDPKFLPQGYPKQRIDQLLFAAFGHDIGKLDGTFQTMLHASRAGELLPTKRIKHEASTLDYACLLKEGHDEVCTHFREALGFEITTVPNMDDTLAFAVTHHGLFYLSFEAREGQVVPRIRREWTVFNYAEQRRITLADLLFDYHPMGGLVIIADLVASFCFEQGIADGPRLVRQARSLADLVDMLLREEVPEKVEQSISRYDPRPYGLRELLILLAGGLA